jgi:hypothetical protein
MPAHSVYGLTLCSEVDLPLPQIEASGVTTPDVFVFRGPVRLIHPDPGASPAYEIDAGAIRIRYDDVGAFAIEAGTRITVDPDPACPPERLQQYLLGVPLALLLRQRGCLVLHASAVAREGHVLAFMGPSRIGKSTLTAALLGAGCSFVADDVLALRVTEAGSAVLPGPPQFRLWPDSLTHLGEAPERLPVIHPAFSKRIRPVSEASEAVPRPVGALFVLETGDRARVELLPLQERFRALIEQTYLSRSLQATGHAAEHFRQCSALVRHTPVYRLVRPHRFEELPDLLACLEEVALHD